MYGWTLTIAQFLHLSYGRQGGSDNFACGFRTLLERLYVYRFTKQLIKINLERGQLATNDMLNYIDHN